MCTGYSFGGDWKDAARAKIALHAERLSVLSEKYRDIENYYQVKAWEVSQMNSVSKSLANGVADGWTTEAGYRLEAYFSKIDGSAQPFWTYVPAKKVEKPGLLVYLHGYSSSMNILLAPKFPPEFAEIAEKTGAYVVAPFGRANTDYQHIGEADVLHVIDEMAERYRIDRHKVVLCGVSMGGLGAWCIGARHADLFNAIVVICGRGDFYVWHEVKPEEVPVWQRKIIDVQFATKYISNLTNTVITASHGLLDDVVTYNQGAYLPALLRNLGSDKVKMITLTQEGHDAYLASISDAAVANTLFRGVTQIISKQTECGVKPRFTGDAGSMAMNALLSPFLMISGAEYFGAGYPEESFKERISEWERFGQGAPNAKVETKLTLADVQSNNIFVFGEPEYSPVIRTLFKRSGISFTADSISYAGKRFERTGRGFIFTMPSPFNKNKTAVVQCGLPWCLGQTDNHRFDRIPDVICYTAENDEYGYPVAEAAGFLDDDLEFHWAE